MKAVRISLVSNWKDNFGKEIAAMWKDEVQDTRLAQGIIKKIESATGANDRTTDAPNDTTIPVHVNRMRAIPGDGTVMESIQKRMHGSDIIVVNLGSPRGIQEDCPEEEKNCKNMPVAKNFAFTSANVWMELGMALTLLEERRRGILQDRLEDDLPRVQRVFVIYEKDAKTDCAHLLLPSDLIGLMVADYSVDRDADLTEKMIRWNDSSAMVSALRRAVKDATEALGQRNVLLGATEKDSEGEMENGSGK
jgi:hypothetical protein